MATTGLPDDIKVFERGWLSSNNILLKSPDGRHALVDSGYDTHAEQTLQLVHHALGKGRLATLLNTHLHSDHCGGNASLQSDHPGMQTLIPVGCAEAVGNWDPSRLSYAATGQRCKRFTYDGVLIPGESVEIAHRTWQIHAAPGHDPDAVLLFEPVQGLLISADALWEHGFGVVFPELEGEDAFGEVARTLDVIEQLAPRLVIPGHGRVFGDVRTALQKAHDRLNKFIEQPQRHANHAAKVLLKFKLLEWGRIPRTDLNDWALNTPYFARVHARYFSGQTPQDWLDQLVRELCAAGAAQCQGGHVQDGG